MKITICKQPLEIIPYQEVELPGTGVSLLGVGMEQGSGLTLWLESYENGAKATCPKKVQVYVVPTGYSGDEIIGAAYVGTVLDFSGADWHVYVFGAAVRR